MTLEKFETMTAGLRKGTHLLRISKEFILALPSERIYTSTSTGQKQWTRITSHKKEVIQLLLKLGILENVHFKTGNSAPMNGILGEYIEKLQPMSKKKTLKEHTTIQEEFENVIAQNPS
jgi:hypothetical protein